MNPFRFHTESSVVLHTPWRADSLRSLLECVRTVSGSCIFYHFFDALRRRHFTTFEFRNDFARWVASNFEEPRLAERLAVLDPLEYNSVRATREALIDRLEAAIGGSEHPARVSFFFHFMEARLRMGRPANDYSAWLADCCGEQTCAEAVARLSPYVLPLTELRDHVAATIRRECAR